MVTLQKSLEGADAPLQQQHFQLQQQQQQVALQKQALQQSGPAPTGAANVQPVQSSVRSAPSSVQAAGQQQQPVLPIKLFGVGIFFATDNNGGQVVRSFVPGGPAERSGQVDIGDVIVSVDNTDVYGLPLATLAKYLLGPRGSTISMGFCKPHDKTVRTFCYLVYCMLIFLQGRINRVLITRGASEEDRKGQLQQQQQMQQQQNQVVQVSPQIPHLYPGLYDLVLLKCSFILRSSSLLQAQIKLLPGPAACYLSVSVSVRPAMVCKCVYRFPLDVYVPLLDKVLMAHVLGS